MRFLITYLLLHVGLSSATSQIIRTNKQVSFDHTKFDSTLIGKTVQQTLDFLKIDTTFVSTFSEPESKVHGLTIFPSVEYEVTLYFTKSVIGFNWLKKKFLPLTIGMVCIKGKPWTQKCWGQLK